MKSDIRRLYVPPFRYERRKVLDAEDSEIVAEVCDRGCSVLVCEAIGTTIAELLNQAWAEKEAAPLTFSETLTPNNLDYCNMTWAVQYNGFKVGYLNRFGTDTYSFDVLGDHPNDTQRHVDLESAKREYSARHRAKIMSMIGQAK